MCVRTLYDTNSIRLGGSLDNVCERSSERKRGGIRKQSRTKHSQKPETEISGIQKHFCHHITLWRDYKLTTSVASVGIGEKEDYGIDHQEQIRKRRRKERGRVGRQAGRKEREIRMSRGRCAAGWTSGGSQGLGCVSRAFQVPLRCWGAI